MPPLAKVGDWVPDRMNAPGRNAKGRNAKEVSRAGNPPRSSSQGWRACSVIPFKGEAWSAMPLRRVEAGDEKSSCSRRRLSFRLLLQFLCSPVVPPYRAEQRHQ
jgi:hypothetical protein